MKPSTVSLLTHAGRRGHALAWLTVALLAMAVVPLPAVAVAVRVGIVGSGLGGVAAHLRTLLLATPLFALPPFVLGGALGTFFHLVSTAPERFEALEAGRAASLNPRSMVASALFVGSAFAACGLVLAETALRLS